MRVRFPERDTPLQTEHRSNNNNNNDMRPPQNGGRRRRTRHRRFQNPGQFHEQFPQPDAGPPQLTAEQLAEKTKTELIALAGELEIEILTPAKLKKDDIIASILGAQAARSGLEMASGILDRSEEHTSE